MASIKVPYKYTYYSDAPKTTKFDKFLNGYGMYICILASIIFFVIAMLLALINNFPKIIVMIVLGIAFLFLFGIPYIIFKIIYKHKKLGEKWAMNERQSYLTELQQNASSVITIHDAIFIYNDDKSIEDVNTKLSELLYHEAKTEGDEISLYYAKSGYRVIKIMDGKKVLIISGFQKKSYLLIDDNNPLLYEFTSLKPMNDQAREYFEKLLKSYSFS